AVRALVRRQHQRALRRALAHLLRRHTQHPRAGGARLVHRGPADRRRADHAHDPRQAVERRVRRHGGAEHAVVELRRIDAPALELRARDVGGEGQGVQVREAALPAGEGRGPVSAVGNVGFAHRAISLSAFLSILPTGVRGSSGTSASAAGTLYFARLALQCASSASTAARAPGRRTTKAFTTSPRYASGTPTAAASCTAGCSASTSSISRGYTL